MGTHFALNTMEGALPMILDEVDKFRWLVVWDKGSDFHLFLFAVKVVVACPFVYFYIYWGTILILHRCGCTG